MLYINHTEQGLRLKVFGSTQVLSYFFNIAFVLCNSKHQHMDNPQPFFLLFASADLARFHQLFLYSNLFVIALRRRPAPFTTAIHNSRISMKLVLGIIFELIWDLFKFLFNLVELGYIYATYNVFFENLLLSRWLAFRCRHLSRIL